MKKLATPSLLLAGLIAFAGVAQAQTASATSDVPVKAGEASTMTQGVPNAGAFRAGMRDWVIANPQEALALLPEWNRLLQAVRS